MAAPSVDAGKSAEGRVDLFGLIGAVELSDSQLQRLLHRRLRDLGRGSGARPGCL